MAKTLRARIMRSMSLKTHCSKRRYTMADTRTIKTWRNPYDAGFSTTRATKVTFAKGITVLVGCNGAGKTTLLNNIESKLKKDHIPVFNYSNENARSDIITKASFYGNFDIIAASKCSSEGENVSLCFGQKLKEIRHFIATGKTISSRPFFVNDDASDSPESSERWILIDAVDSGYSIDNILDLKAVFGYMQDDAKKHGVDLYIIVSTNAYEFANNETCLDVITGKPIRFDSYDDYKKFVIKSREKKEKRESK